MTILAAERSFREGLVALVEARHIDAASCFDKAMKDERARGGSPEMRYLSYYGLSVALGQGPTREAIQACEMAARRDFFNADLQLNLGKVYLLASRRSKALAILERGLKLDPTHKGLLATMRRADRRRQAPVRWLRRAHPLNYWLGKMRPAVARTQRQVTARP